MLLVVLITALGVALRLYAAPRLPVDADERVYLQAAIDYANFLRQGEFRKISWYNFHPEHPAFYKLIYGITLLPLPPLEKLWSSDMIDGLPMSHAGARQYGLIARYVSVVFGGISVLVLASINPFAGLFFAIHTYAIQYTSTIFLEALPILMSLLSVLSFQQWTKKAAAKSLSFRENISWIGLSAAFLGMAVASKYTYAVAGLAILVGFVGYLIKKEKWIVELWKPAVWGVWVIIFFFTFNPYLWTGNSLNRLRDSILFHNDHTQSTRVVNADYPVYQPLIWFSTPFSQFRPNAQTSFRVEFDLVISLLSLIGIPRLLKRHTIFFIWLVIGLLMLLAWPTKWPQYTMIIIVPVCISASMGMMFLYDRLVKIPFWSGREKPF